MPITAKNTGKYRKKGSQTEDLKEKGDVYAAKAIVTEPAIGFRFSMSRGMELRVAS